MEKIYVTKSFLPPYSEYESYLKKIWDNDQLTNQGYLLHEFESQLHAYLGLSQSSSIQFVVNGTMALQLALRALDITEGEVITTPFTYVATTSSILWERCKPVFVDINPETLCIDSSKIEAAITPKTRAIMPVHVFGNACDVTEIERIAAKYKLKVIYDGAHAFGAYYKGKPLLDYGDISMCSFHATKLFHTIEGGCLITRDSALSNRIELLKRFGHNDDNHYLPGINGKATEFSAAMGLCNLKYVDKIIENRKNSSLFYDQLLGTTFQRPKLVADFKYNYGYYPIIFTSEQALLATKKALEKEGIYPRRYFYPSLNTLPYLHDRQDCPVSESIAPRILCLPLYYQMGKTVIKKICGVVHHG